MKEKYKTCQRADKLHRSNSYMFQVVECNRYMKRIKDGKYMSMATRQEGMKQSKKWSYICGAGR